MTYIWPDTVSVCVVFVQRYGVGQNGVEKGRTTLSLLDDLENSRLFVRLKVFGAEAHLWQHSKDQEGCPAHPVVQVGRLFFVLLLFLGRGM